MTAPRHLWSGDWRRESAAAARSIAEGRVEHDEPTPAPPKVPPPPPRPSAAARARAWLARARERQEQRPARPPVPPRAAARPPAPARPRPPRATPPARGWANARAVLVLLAVLVSAGVAYAAVSSLVGSDGGSSAPPAAASSAAAPAWLGAEMGSFASAGGSSFPSAGGVVVTNVVPGSPADAAGLEPGDLITQIDNLQVGSPNDVNSAIAARHPGQQVQIQYQRGPFANSAEVTLSARPSGSP